MINDNYIKMCEQAEEIQKLKKKRLSNQDFVAYDFGKGKKVYICAEISGYWVIDNLIWIPTQEQLQEMIKEYWKIDLNIFAVYFQFAFSDWIHDQLRIKRMRCGDDIFTEYKDDINSLLLCFVMHEKYNKIWTGKRWEEVIK